MMKYFFILICMSFLTLSCEQESAESYTVIDAPSEIANRAYNFAELYAESDTVYAWGGQDAVRAIKIDCSGLVIMSYKYALVDTNYQLLVSDMTAAYMHNNASTIISKEQLRKGDLLFMGELDSESVTHIAIFEKRENGLIYFIDSTQKDTNEDGIDDINGVTKRFYQENDMRFKAFGVMRIKY